MVSLLFKFVITSFMSDDVWSVLRLQVADAMDACIRLERNKDSLSFGYGLVCLSGSLSLKC